MTFVPYVPVPPPSARATELSHRLTEVIESYRQHHPDMSATEARQALGLARQQVGSKRPAIVAVVLAALVAVAGVGLLAARSAKSMPIPAVVLVLVVGALIAAFGLIAALANR